MDRRPLARPRLPDGYSDRTKALALRIEEAREELDGLRYSPLDPSAWIVGKIDLDRRLAQIAIDLRATR